MKQITSLIYTMTTMGAFVVCLSLLPAGTSCGQEKTNPDAATSDFKTVSLSKFAFQVPSAWPVFTPGDTAQLRDQFMVQSKQIYQQYSGSSEDPTKSVDVAAFHLEPEDGALIAVALTIPPHSDLITTLRREAKQKAEWGVQQGFIRQYLGLVEIDEGELSGFYIKSLGRNGNVEVTGGLEHRMLKNTLIQLTLICPKTWDVEKATKTLTQLLKSAVLSDHVSKKTSAKEP